MFCAGLVFVITTVLWCMHHVMTHRITCKNDMYTTSGMGTTEIPHVVWYYWEGKHEPNVVSFAKHTWKQTFPTMKIKKISENDIEGCRCCKQAETAMLRSDYARLYVLKKHGGVYLDSTVLGLRKVKLPPRTFHAFFNERNMMSCHLPVIETSFLASYPNHPLVSNWYDLMDHIGCQSVNRSKWYEKHKHIMHVKWLDPSYHFVYYVNYWILHIKGLRSFPQVHLKGDSHYRYMPLSITSYDSVPKLLFDKPVRQQDWGDLLKLTHFEYPALNLYLERNRTAVPNSWMSLLR